MGLAVTHHLAARGFETSLQPFVQPHDDLHDMPQINGVNPRSRESFIDQQFAAARPSQPSNSSRCARIATPIVGLLVAGAGAYALASGVNRDNYDQTDTYHLNLVNGLSGAAGAVGGALVSWLADTAVRTYCCVRERAVQPLPRRTGAETFRSELQAAALAEASTSVNAEDPVPEQQPQESDFANSQPDAQGEVLEAEPGEPTPVNLQKIPVGGVKLAEAAELDYYIGVVNKGKAAQGDNKQS